MTYSLDRCPDVAAGSSVLPMLDWLDTVQLVTLKANRWNDEWDLSITDKKIGTVHRVPSWICDETFEGNPSHVFECHPYGYCATKGEAIGRLFTGWLVATEIADPDVWLGEPRETGLPDYI
jgi:hypothetical protein